MIASGGKNDRDPAAAEIRAEMVKALTGLKYDADLALAQKTRRAVRSAAIVLAERRAHQRRTIGIAIAAILVMALLLAPVIWNAIEDLSAGGRLSDTPTEFLFLFMMLVPAVFGALFAAWKHQHDTHHDRSI